VIHFTGIDTASKGMFVVQIMDYSANDKHKSILSRMNHLGSTDTATNASASRWANTAVVTSVTIFSGTGYTQPFASGSTFSLFGVAA
jgi:hypothetical protein